AETLPVETGLEGDDVTGDELAGRAGEPGALVHLEADAVTEAVEEAAIEHLARCLRQLGRVARRLEHIAHEPEDVLPGDPGARRRERAVECSFYEPVVLDDLARRLADDEGAGHVRVARGLLVPGEQIDDDRLAGGDRAEAHLVADCTLRAGSDDELVGDG